ncbi:hypothetical protein [Streptomyces sp. NPDC088350]|uniref:hypothetical protein n=1 Tax=Streptomyces sp. NPDC088350 TaxID=3365854 RepID=UPI00382BDE00
MTDMDIKARLAAMFPQSEPDYSTLLAPKPKAKAKQAKAEPEAQEENDSTDVGEPQAEVEPEPERQYFVRNRQNERLPTDQFNIEEGKRWVADHFGPAKQPAFEDVPDGHYASDDVSQEEYAAAYERYTGSPYRPRCYTIKSNRPL